MTMAPPCGDKDLLLPRGWGCDDLCIRPRRGGGAQRQTQPVHPPSLGPEDAMGSQAPGGDWSPRADRSPWCVVPLQDPVPGCER